MWLLPAAMSVYHPVRYFMDIGNQKLIPVQVSVHGDGMRTIPWVIAIIAKLRNPFSGEFKIEGMLLPERQAVISSTRWHFF